MLVASNRQRSLAMPIKIQARIENHSSPVGTGLTVLRTMIGCFLELHY